MSAALLMRLELDVLQINELQDAVDMSVHNNFQAMVVQQILIPAAILARGRRRGRFKIIAPIDWPKGENYGIDKFRGISTDALSADGFEFLLTGGLTSAETANEATLLTKFVREHLGQHVEIRFVLGAQLRTPENYLAICTGLVKIATPSFIRTDCNLKTQINKANPETHNNHIQIIRSVVRAPLKISGNINSVRTMMACQDATRYAVNLDQARTIIKEVRQQPNLKQLV